jgi:hypothetical protein
MVNNTAKHYNQPVCMGIKVKYKWVSLSRGVEEIDRADKEAMVSATNEASDAQVQREKYHGWSMAEVQRQVTKTKWTENEIWWKTKHNNKKWVYRMNRNRMRHTLLGEAKQMIVGR